MTAIGKKLKQAAILLREIEDDLIEQLSSEELITLSNAIVTLEDLGNSQKG